MTIYHLVTEDVWSATVGAYAPASLASEGFVHASTQAQVARVARERFADRDDLLLLVIDPTRLSAVLRWEDSHANGELFPHIYGPVDRDAVVAVHPYDPGRAEPDDPGRAEPDDPGRAEPDGGAAGA